MVTHSCYFQHGALCTGPIESRRLGLLTPEEKPPLSVGVAFIWASGYCGNKHKGRRQTRSRGTANVETKWTDE